MFDFLLLQEVGMSVMTQESGHTIISQATPQQLHSKSLATTQNILATN